MGFWSGNPRLSIYDNGDDMTCIAFSEHEFAGIAGVFIPFYYDSLHIDITRHGAGLALGLV